jgi:hypothetical protein
MRLFAFSDASKTFAYLNSSAPWTRPVEYVDSQLASDIGTTGIVIERIRHDVRNNSLQCHINEIIRLSNVEGQLKYGAQSSDGTVLDGMEDESIDDGSAPTPDWSASLI